MRPLKEGLGPATIRRLVHSLGKVQPNLNQAALTQDCIEGLDRLELKQRVRHVISALERHLPSSFSKAAPLLMKLPANWEYGDPQDPLRGFAAWPVIDYVGEHGVDDFELGMETLKVLTPLFTAEFAIRPFLRANPEAAFTLIEEWISSPDEKVRRLCSEGLRPRLPWGTRVEFLDQNPEKIIAVLDRLHADPSEDVRRSVANALNDIAKLDPAPVIRACKHWMTLHPTSETQKLVKHALRTLVKSGHPGALSLLGVNNSAKVVVDSFCVRPTRLTLGGSLSLTLTLRSASSRSQPLIVDFVIHHKKANGSFSPKVFKWKSFTLEREQRVELSKNHPIRPITTRRYYPGRHRVELLINGQCMATEDFELRLPPKPKR